MGWWVCILRRAIYEREAEVPCFLPWQVQHVTSMASEHSPFLVLITTVYSFQISCSHLLRARLLGSTSGLGTLHSTGRARFHTSILRDDRRPFCLLMKIWYLLGYKLSCSHGLAGIDRLVTNDRRHIRLGSAFIAVRDHLCSIAPRLCRSLSIDLSRCSPVGQLWHLFIHESRRPNHIPSQTISSAQYKKNLSHTCFRT